MNPYFDLGEPEVISDVEGLLSLNIEKMYFRPGDQARVEEVTSAYYSGHVTSGLFRGQLEDWPLVPKCFRGTNLAGELSDTVRSLGWFQATRKFTEFCSRAEVQNPSFPSEVFDRMSIAQHFGVPTPLLDWSQSIFAAVFFAVCDVFKDPHFEEKLKVFVYHVVDERLLGSALPKDVRLSKIGRSAFVKPYHIDRRIERQRGVFSFHPHPAHQPRRVPAKVYVLEWGVIDRMLDLMKGFGFTEDYFFPDYAGIARAVMSGSAV